MSAVEGGKPSAAAAKPSAANGTIVSVTVDRRELNSRDVPELREVYGIDALPLAPSHVAIVMNCSTQVVNALRRVVIDEMPGRALSVPPDGFDVHETTDRLMLPQFVNGRIAHMPLRPQIPADVVASLRLKLDVTNRGATVLSVYSGDLEVTAGALREPIFNPTFKLASLQPGKRIVINDIQIATGMGRDDAAYNVARRGAFSHLDIAQHTDAEIRDEDGVAADKSGYKVSCMVANPQVHRLTATIPATTANLAETRAVFVDACGVIKGRLRLIAATITDQRLDGAAAAGSPSWAHNGAQYTVVQLDDGLAEGILYVVGETDTIGSLLRRAVNDTTPDVSNVTYAIVAHENRMRFSVRHAGDATAVLSTAVAYAIDTFDIIQRGIAAAR